MDFSNDICASFANPSHTGLMLMSQRPTVSQRIASEIHEQILRRFYNPGERLPTERELAAHYGVSRIPVREAMKILEQRGVIEAKHGSGNYVTSIDEQKIVEQISQYILFCNTDFSQLTGFWDILESHAVAETALRRTPEQCGEIRRMADDCAAEIKSALAGQPHAYNEADYALHAAIAKTAGNPIVTNLICSFHKSLRMRQSVLDGRPETLGKIIGIHEALVKGIERQEPDLARRAWKEDFLVCTDIFAEFKHKSELRELLAHQLS